MVRESKSESAIKDQRQNCFLQLVDQILLLRDARFVAQFQRYFGLELKAKSCKIRTNGDGIASGNHDYKNGLKQLNGNIKSHGIKHTREIVEDDSSSNNDGNDETCNYKINNIFWYYLFSFGASLGYETFYATFFPFWFWNIDSAVGRRMVLVWVIIMYFGQVLKDIIRWPRPASPPVVILEPEYAVEFGMPSTHAMVGSALPTTILIFTMHRYEYPTWIGLVIGLSWCILVCASRLYMGMHTILDIIAGLLLTAVLMVILIPLVDAIDHFHLTSPYSPLITIPIIVLLALFYPKSERWSPARGDTCVIMGSASGILIGSWLNYQLGVYVGPSSDPPFPIMWPGYQVIGLSLVRACIGIFCVCAMRAVGKAVIFTLLCHLSNLDPKDPKTKINTNVEIPCKVINYISLGLTITYLSPLIFRFLDIERITMFTEI